jgi:hypothetical protein
VDVPLRASTTTRRTAQRDRDPEWEVDVEPTKAADGDLGPVGEEEQHRGRRHPPPAPHDQDVTQCRTGHGPADQQQPRTEVVVRRDRVDVAGHVPPGQHGLHEHGDQVGAE